MKGKGFFREIYKNRALYSMFLPAAAVLILFNYLPMFGMVTAFKDFNFGDGIFGSPWISPVTKNFEYLFSSGSAARATINTVFLNLLFIVFGLIFELGFALMFNELRMKKLRSAVQFGIFLPYFISWIVVGLFSYNLFNYEHGSLNTLLKAFGMEAVNWYENPKMWIVILVIFRIWKMTGYGMIMYIAALGGIDTTLYEAAKIDGANRRHQLMYITIPSLLAIIMTQLVLNLGNVLDVSVEKTLLLSNAMNREVSEVFDSFVYNRGIVNGEYSYSTAVGLFKSSVGVILVLGANWLSKKVTDEAIY